MYSCSAIGGSRIKGDGVSLGGGYAGGGGTPHGGVTTLPGTATEGTDPSVALLPGGGPCGGSFGGGGTEYKCCISGPIDGLFGGVLGAGRHPGYGANANAGGGGLYGVANACICMAWALSGPLDESACMLWAICFGGGAGTCCVTGSAGGGWVTAPIAPSP
jgi:hypothetical protein